MRSIIRYISLIIIASASFIACDRFEENIEPAKDLVFRKYFGGFSTKTGSDLILTSDGGYLLLGSSQSFSGDKQTNEVLLVKATNEGNESWSQIYGRNVEEKNVVAAAIDSLPGGSGYVIAANIDRQTDDDEQEIILFFINAQGDTTQNSAILSPDPDPDFSMEAADVKVASDGGYVVAGTITQPNGNSNIIIIRTDATGTESGFGREEIGVGQSASAMEIIPQAAGLDQIVVLGNTNVALNSDISLIVAQDDPVQVPFPNEATLPLPGDQTGISLSPTRDGGFLIVGDDDPTDRPLLVRISSFGTLLWSKLLRLDTTATGLNDIEGADAIEARNGDILVIGTSQETEGDPTDIFLDRLDAFGDPVSGWDLPQTYGGPRDDIGVAIRETSDQRLIIYGSNTFEGNNSLLMLIQADRLGELIE